MKNIDFELLEKILLTLIAQKQPTPLTDIAIRGYEDETVRAHVSLLIGCACFKLGSCTSCVKTLDAHTTVESVNEMGLRLLQVLRRDPERLRSEFDRFRRLEVAFVQAANVVA
jgi:hypothetical protein